MIIRDAGLADVPGIAAIYNDAVEHSVAIWNEATVDLDNRREWMQERQRRGFPVLVAVEEDRVLGYASYGDWRPFDGYRHTVEHSVYILPAEQGRGVGRALMEALIARARSAGLHVMVAAIEADNIGSVALHEKLGFKHAGRLHQVGTKFGRWLDLDFMQLRLG